jgi:tetratricopeptide (TPR) repeat protein
MALEIEALLLAGFVGLGCIQKSEPKLPPSEQVADERHAIEEAARHVAEGVRAVETDDPPLIAKRHAEEGLATLRKHGLLGSIWAAKLYDLLGRAEHAAYSYEHARAAFLLEIDILKKTGAKPNELGRVLTRIGATYSAQKDYASAEVRFEAARKLHEADPKDHLAYVDNVVALAALYLATQRTAQARSISQSALKFPRPGAEREDVRIWALEMTLAETHRYDGNPNAAIPHFLAASAAAGRHERALAKKRFDAFERLSRTYFALGRRAEAVLVREDSLACWKRDRGSAAPDAEAITELADWYLALGRHDDAKRVLPRFGLVIRLRSAGDQEAADGWPRPPVEPTRKSPTPTAPNQGNISNAAKVVADMRPRFRACYQQSLDRDASLQGTIRMAIRVAADGSVANATGVSFDLPAETIDCLLERALAATFDPPGGGAAVVNVPVNFVKR